MSADFVQEFEGALTPKFEALGLRRMSRGLYVRTSDGTLWQGTLVTFNRRNGVLVAQPNLAVFCPLVDRILAEYFKSARGNNRYLSGFGKLGVPVLICPLDDLVNRFRLGLRNAFAYSVEAIGQIEETTRLLVDDFVKVQDSFFLGSNTFEELRDRLKVDGSTGARMREIVVSYYLLGAKISSEKVDRIAGPNSNEMTQKFAEYFKLRFAGNSN